MQTTIDFTIHQREGNPESQAHLDDNRVKFSKQCAKVYDLLKSGIRLTRLTAATEYNILSLERRVKDLRENQVTIKTEWIKGVNGKRLFKEYYL